MAKRLLSVFAFSVLGPTSRPQDTNQVWVGDVIGLVSDNGTKTFRCAENLPEDGTAVLGAVGDLREALATRSVTEINQGAQAAPNLLENKDVGATARPQDTNHVWVSDVIGEVSDNETMTFQCFEDFSEDGTAVSGAVGDLSKGLAARNDMEISHGAYVVTDLLNNKVESLREDGTAVSGAVEDLRKGMATRNVTEISQSAPAIPDLLNYKSGSLLEDVTASRGAVRDLRKGLEFLKNVTEPSPNYEYFDLDDPSETVDAKNLADWKENATEPPQSDLDCFPSETDDARTFADWNMDATEWQQGDLDCFPSETDDARTFADWSTDTKTRQQGDLNSFPSDAVNARTFADCNTDAMRKQQGNGDGFPPKAGYTRTSADWCGCELVWSYWNDELQKHCLLNEFDHEPSRSLKRLGARWKAKAESITRSETFSFGCQTNKSGLPSTCTKASKNLRPEKTEEETEIKNESEMDWTQKVENHKKKETLRQQRVRRSDLSSKNETRTSRSQERYYSHSSGRA